MLLHVLFPDFGPESNASLMPRMILIKNTFRQQLFQRSVNVSMMLVGSHLKTFLGTSLSPSFLKNLSG